MTEKNLASKLKHRIVLEKPVYVSDLLGGFVTSWNKHSSCWAEVIPLKFEQKLKNEKLENLSQYKVIMREPNGFALDMRIVFKGKFLSIVSVAESGNAMQNLEIIAREIK